MSFTYKGLSATLTHHHITKEEIDGMLEQQRQRSPKIELVENRPTQLGDEVILDYAGFCDGEQFAGGTAENQSLVLGSGTFIPGFEEQLVGKTIGEKVVVNVTFPTAYHAENLAGKEAQFHCTIHQIRLKKAYALDDVFAQEVGGCQTLEELREQTGKNLQSMADQQSEMELQDQLLRQAAATLDVTISEEDLEKAVSDQVRNFQSQLTQQGLSLEMYCNFLNTTVEDIREKLRPTAEVVLRNQAAVEEISRLENLEATPQDIGEAVSIICRQNGMTIEQLKPHYTPEFEQAVVKSILTSKVMRLIRDAANITLAE